MSLHPNDVKILAVFPPSPIKSAAFTKTVLLMKGNACRIFRGNIGHDQVDSQRPGMFDQSIQQSYADALLRHLGRNKVRHLGRPMQRTRRMKGPQKTEARDFPRFRQRDKRRIAFGGHQQPSEELRRHRFLGIGRKTIGHIVVENVDYRLSMSLRHRLECKCHLLPPRVGQSLSTIPPFVEPSNRLRHFSPKIPS